MIASIKLSNNCLDSSINKKYVACDLRSFSTKHFLHVYIVHLVMIYAMIKLLKRFTRKTINRKENIEKDFHKVSIAFITIFDILLGLNISILFS